MTHIYFISGRLETCKDFAPNCDEVIKNEGGCGDEYVQYGCKKSCKLCAEGKEDDNMSDINILISNIYTSIISLFVVG